MFKRNAWILPHCLSPKPYPVVVDFDAYLEFGGIINKENGIKKKPMNVVMNMPLDWEGPLYRKTIKVCYNVNHLLIGGLVDICKNF